MKRMSPEARVGLLVLSGLLILVYMTLKIGKLGFGPEGGYSLYLRLDNAAGIAKDSEVLVAGIPVGVVRDVRLDRGQALLVLHLQDKVKLPKDSTANIRTHGVLGEKYVAVVPGGTAELLKDGDALHTTAVTGDLDRLLASFTKIGDDVSRIAASFSEVFAGPDGERSLREIVAGLRDTARGLSQLVAANSENLRVTIANAERFSGVLANRGSSVVANMDRLTTDLSGVVSENRENLRQSLANLKDGTARLAKAVDAAEGLFTDARNPSGTLGRLMHDDALYRELTDAVASLSAVAKNLEKGQGTLGKLVKDDKLYADLQESVENLKTITGKVNHGQGTLGKLVNDQSVHDNINTTLTGISDYVGATNRFQFEPSLWGEYLLSQGEMRGYFNLDVRPRPDRFYRVGVVKDPGGRVSTKTVKVTDSATGQTVSKQEKKTTDDQYRISVELAKKFSFLTVRGGLIESTAGIGLDADLWNDRLKLSIEGFDFGGNQGGPHVKAGARWDVWSHLFLTGGADAEFGANGRSGAFVGAGIHFLDDDLKYMFSSLGSLVK
ncbi:MAG: MCE family protein [Deltaproteobacteria bacterium]|nr:MCE family protein [Deltaproteobacteria bacterium]